MSGDETVASLGFEVGSQPLKDATQDLKSLSDPSLGSKLTLDRLAATLPRSLPSVQAPARRPGSICYGRSRVSHASSVG
jgi:hypothetical protein